MIGNRLTLEAGSQKTQLWTRILSHLESTASIFEGFPALCESHSNISLCSTPEDFDVKCPNGGCLLECGKPYTGCNHACRMKCHQMTCQPCQVSVQRKCSRGLHMVTTKCGSKDVVKCQKEVEWMCDGVSGRVHTNQKKCFLDKNPICRTCDKIFELEEKMQQEEDEFRQKQNAIDNEIQMKNQEAEHEIKKLKLKQETYAKKKELELLETKQKLIFEMNQNSGLKDIDDALEKRKTEADDEIMKVKHKIEQQIKNRYRTAEKEMKKIDKDRTESIANLKNAMDVDGETLKVVVEELAKELSERKHRSSWKSPPQRTFEKGAGSVHLIYPQDIKDGIDCIEQTEFNFAAMQLLRLTGKDKTIKYIEVYHSPGCDAKWNIKRQELATQLNVKPKDLKTVWVFHGTNVDAMKSICETGFRVARGGQITNGAVHGFGIYTATGPDTPMGYSHNQGASATILSKALIGTQGASPRSNQESPSHIHSWVPRGDWRVFKDGEQLLPTYIIHYN